MENPTIDTSTYAYVLQAGQSVMWGYYEHKQLSYHY